MENMTKVNTLTFDSVIARHVGEKKNCFVSIFLFKNGTPILPVFKNIRCIVKQSSLKSRLWDTVSHVYVYFFFGGLLVSAAQWIASLHR